MFSVLFARQSPKSQGVTARAKVLGRVALVAAAVFVGNMAPQAAWATLPEHLTEQQKTAIAKAEGQLSAVNSLEARFEQVSDNGALARGTVAIKRPGRMRLDYDAPSKIMVIANGTHLIYIDKELDQTSYISLDSTPAGILLRSKVSLSDPDITVTDVREQDGTLEIDVIMSGDPGAGTLTLVFNASSFELRQWRMKDAQGITTTVILSDVRKGIALDNARFEYVEKQRPLLQDR